MERSFRLAAILLFAAVSPAFAHTWLIDGKKVDGDFVREGQDQYRTKSGKMLPAASVIISVRGKDQSYQLSKLSYDDKKYEQRLVEEQKDTAKKVEERSWKNKNGKSENGRLIGMEGNKAVMLAQRNDWKETRRLAFKDFSREDRDYIRKEMIARGEGDKVPAEPPPNAHPKPDGSKVAHQGKKPDKPKAQTVNPPANGAPVNGAPLAAPQQVASTSRPPEAGHPETAHPAIVHPASEQHVAAQSNPVSPTTGQPALGKTTASKPAQSVLAKTTAEPKRAVVAAATVPPPPAAKSKVCSACGHKLEDTVKEGDSCPYCGVYLQYEDTGQGPPLQMSSTFRTLGAPAGLASLCCLIAVAVFRIRSYAQQ